MANHIEFRKFDRCKRLIKAVSKIEPFAHISDTTTHPMLIFTYCIGRLIKYQIEKNIFEFYDNLSKHAATYSS